jgi:hypothetical protein
MTIRSLNLFYTQCVGTALLTIASAFSFIIQLMMYWVSKRYSLLFTFPIMKWDIGIQRITFDFCSLLYPHAHYRDRARGGTKADPSLYILYRSDESCYKGKHSR